MRSIFKGVKNIQIRATTRYPIVSAYEFEFLKSQEAIRNLLKPCTIYFIIQRPLTYINNLRADKGLISFEIIDGSANSPLQCRFEPAANGFCSPEDELLLELQFYKKKADEQPPYADVAAFQLQTLNGESIAWFTAQMFLYGVCCGTLNAEIRGNIADYLDYEVHYIGKAFSQNVWKRLTGHEKMQSILTLEDALNKKSLRAPFEISLLMLDIDGFTEANLFPFTGFGVTQGIEPIIHEFSLEDDDGSFERYSAPALQPRASELTSEVEALLVSTFRPKYNDVMFENYPNIGKGTRSAGYTESYLLIEKLPALLRTASHTQMPIWPAGRRVPESSV